MTISLDSVRGRNVLLKVAYDLPSIDDTDRIEQTLDTIKLLLKHNNRVIISTHWGRPDGVDKSLSTEPLAPLISKLYKRKFGEKLDVQYLNHFDYFNRNNEKRLRRVLNLFKAQVVLLENSRFSASERSKSAGSRTGLSNKYAFIADALVDDAFPLSHRSEVTNTDLKNILPWTYGLGYTEELENLKKLANPEKPFTLILGGAKLATKLPILEHLLPKADHVLLAGQAAFPFIQLQGNVDLQKTKVDSDHKELVQKLWNGYQDKIILPTDFKFNSKGEAMDIGENTITAFTNAIDESKSIFWNGPMGKYEDDDFCEGTKQIASHIAKLKDAFTVVGGGDTIANLTPARKQKISHVSTGGGATLEYLASL